MAASMIKVPGIGPVKSTYVYAGVGVSAGILIYAYWRSSQAAPAVDEEPVGEDAPMEVEPEYEYVSDGSYGGGGPSSYPWYVGPNYNTPTPSGYPTTNAEWAQKAREELAGEGADAAQASSAIGNYLARLCLSSSQADLVRRATAMLGAPPQGTYSVIPCPAGDPPPGSGNPPAGSSLPAPGGVRVLRVFRTEVQVGWNAVPGAAGYAVYRSEPSGSTATWQRQTTSRYPSFQFKGLRPNTSYRFRIEPVGNDNKPGKSAIISARTAKK